MNSRYVILAEMTKGFPIQFESPIFLWLLLLVIPVYFIARLGSKGQSRVKFWTSLVVRSILIATLSMALARPSIVERGEALTLMVVADVSRSIPRTLQRQSQDFLQRIEEARLNVEDRIGVVSVAKSAEIQETPDVNSRIDIGTHAGDLSATNLGDAIRTAVSILPTDTANRILLVSDGNETEQNILEATELARANGIPIDVLPIEYEYSNEVVFESLRAPARARLGQSVDLRASLRTGSAVQGKLRLWQNDRPVDLNPGSPDEGYTIELEPGTRAVNIPVSLDSGGAQRFRIQFEPDNLELDRISENNVYEAVTFVSGDGRVLFVDEGGLETSSLVKSLRDSGIEAIVEGPEVLSQGAAYLNGFDAVVLANVPRWAINNTTDRALRSWVHDLGGGLVMMGGDQSFGAGGWIDSETAEALPVRLDPPQERQMVRGALALIMHSCEMSRGNYWGQQVAIAAVDALSSLDYVGIITFSFGGGGGPGNVNGASWAFPMQLAGDKQGAIAAAKKMVIGDMPDFGSSMVVAQQGLEPINAGQKHVIIISDGDPQPPSKTLLDKYVASGITVTTVMVSGHGSRTDQMNMKGVANFTGGTFYNVNNPKQLPKIFIKEASMVSRTLIVEGDFQPQVKGSISGPTRGVNAVPPVLGYVLTVPREGLVQVPITISNEEGVDPLLAWWNFGLGKSIAFTSDVSGRWGSGWPGWSGFQGFWEQTMRWVMRPSAPPGLSIRSRIEGDTAIFEVEAINSEGEFTNFLQGEARVLRPDGSAVKADLQQVGPGRYTGEFPIDESGAYLVNVLFPDSEGDISASVQAAVSVPYSKEFATVRDDRAMLESIAQRTGGRVLTTETNLEIFNPYDRTDLAMPSSPTRIWDLLAIIAAGVFLLDVAVRRIAIDGKSAKENARNALASRNADVSDSTVNAWKKAKARSQVDSPSDPQTRFEGGEESSGFSVREDASSVSDSSPVARRSTERSDLPVNSDEDGDTTSRLLKAKRRAQGPDGTTGTEDDGAGNG